MIIECEKCRAKFRYDDSRFEGKPSKKIKCTKCGNIFEIKNPALPPKAASPASPAPSDSASVPRGGDATYIKRPMSAAEREETTKQQRLAAARRVAEPSLLKLPTDKRYSLAIIAGPDAGKIFPIEKARVVIGRNNADVPLSDSEVSRQHAALEITAERMTLVDLGSTNGTYVAEKKIDEYPLENHSEFEVGGTTLMLIVTEAV